MAVNVRVFPKTLKNTLKAAGKRFDINPYTFLIEDTLNGNKVIKLDFDLGINASMFDVDGQTSSLSSLKSQDKESFDSLVHEVGIHLFGDNVSVFNKDHPADNGDGSWKILIDNFKDDDEWLVPVVYLVPVGIDI